MRKAFVVGVPLAVGALLLSVLLFTRDVAQAALWQQKVDPAVWGRAVAVSHTPYPTEFLVTLREQANLDDVHRLPTKAARGEAVYQRLTAVAQRTQPPIVALLEKAGAPYRRFWITNMIWVRGDGELVEQLARRADVGHIYANPQVKPDLPEPLDDDTIRQLVQNVEWNVAQVNAPDVWAEGATGQGVVIGGQDTGYDWTHPALQSQYRGWNTGNGATATHDYNWHDAIHEDNSNTAPGNPCGFDSPEPCDDNGHGTHTMGTMTGDDGGSNQIGVAPGAQWIACRNMEQGWGTPASYTECYEWFVAPYPIGGDPMTDGDPAKAPHVINNSWSCPPSEGCTDPDVLLAVVENVRAAGILTVHSAGNSGPSCATVNAPATIYDASFSVGATDNSDTIASFSSRGPVTVDGSNRLKPDVSAPGVSVRSSVPGSGYGSSSGTSMAAPHVAGVAALLMAADPAMVGNVDGVEQVMQETAVPRTTSQGCGGDSDTDVPNHVYGWGRVDALAAYNALTSVTTPTLALAKTAVATVPPGQRLTYTLAVTNTSVATAAHHLTLTDTIPANTGFITATLPHTQTADLLTWTHPTLNAGEVWTVSLTVQAPSTLTGAVVNDDYRVVAQGITAVSGPPITSTITPYLRYVPVFLNE